MTDITQVTEALDLLTTKHTAEMEVKADQAAVTEAVEAVKADAVEAAAAVQVELEAAKAVSAELIIKHEELEAKFAAMPTIQKEAPKMSNEFEKMTGAQGQEQMGKSFNTFSKAVAEGQSVTGGRIDSTSPYFILEQQSIFRNYATVMNTSAGSIKLPNISGVAWAKENTVLQDGSRATGGSIGSATVVVDNWTTENLVSLPALEDLQDFDGMMVKLIARKLAAAENAEAATVLKAGTAGATPTIGKVSTGAAAALPAANAIVGKLMDMVASVTSPYLPNAKFFVSRGLYASISKSNNTTLNFDPASKAMTLAGYPIVVVDVLDDGKTGADVAGYFGDMSAALAMVSRKNLDISRMEQTRPGSMTYFGDARFAFAGWDTTNSICALVTEA